MSDVRIEEIRARSEEATWRYNGETNDIKQLVKDRRVLLAEVDRLKGELAEARKSRAAVVGAAAGYAMALTTVKQAERQRIVEKIKALKVFFVPLHPIGNDSVQMGKTVLIDDLSAAIEETTP